MSAACARAVFARVEKAQAEIAHQPLEARARAKSTPDACTSIGTAPAP